MTFTKNFKTNTKKQKILGGIMGIIKFFKFEEMRCGECGFKTRMDIKICPKCGIPMEKIKINLAKKE